MIEKFKTLLEGDTEDKKLAVLLANHHTDNPEVMMMIDGLALRSSTNNILLFFEILDQDYAGELEVVKNLDYFRCAYNQLTSLPESIGKLKKIEWLDCSRNKLVALPESIGKLENLGILDCSGNKLTFLPESIGQIVNLNVLICSRNQLTSLPESLQRIIGLHIYSEATQ